LQPIITRHKGTKCYITEKIDGSSFTAYLKDDVFGVCSRGVDLKVDDEENIASNAYVKWALENNIEQRMRGYLKQTYSFVKNIAIQGELAGKDIQGNSLQLDGKNVWFFNVFLIDECKYLDFNEFVKAIEDMDLKTVPIITDSYYLSDNIEELVKLSIGKSIINPKVWREGIVIRPLVEKLDLGMSAYNFTTARLSFKVVNTEYLIESEA
jgi:RNA ligase (TIGR02306 family)